jgi:16S rRNA (guanine527-N7)-methyltransferase
VELDERALRRMLIHKSMLDNWNSTRFNLTAIKGDKESALKHFADSLVINLAVNIENASLIDIGTGAGFPGIPLKIAFPSLKLTLLDSKEKKAAFVMMLLRRLELSSDVTLLVARGEEIGKDKKFREQFDIATMRGVGKIPINAEVGLPFLKIGGHLVLWKGEKDIAQVPKFEPFIKELGGEVEKTVPYKLGAEARERFLLVIKKVNKTPAKYPRKYSTMRKHLKQA